MLPFTVRVLATALVNEILSAGTPTLVVVHDGPVPGEPAGRAMTIQRMPTPELAQRVTGVPDMLTDLRDAITNPPTLNPDLGEMVTALTSPIPGMRLTAVGVHYDDLDSSGPSSRTVEHLDAVDLDGRVYEVTRTGDGFPWAVIDHLPDPGDLPATQPGLAAVLAAASLTV